MDKRAAFHQRRKSRIRHKLREVSKPSRLRLCVNRTNQHTYAQIIDDVKAVTIVAASTLEAGIREQLKNGSNKDAAMAVGKKIAEKALSQGIKEIVFDRSGFLYHGRIKALADSARENGLVF